MNQPLKDRFLRGASAPRPRDAHVLRLPILFLMSFALLVLSRLGHPVVKEMRTEAEAWIVPVLGAAIVPFDPLRRLARQAWTSYGGVAEMERLRVENQRLRQWESRAHQLERKLKELGAITKAIEEQSIDFRTVRVIATSNGAFVHSALLEAGTDQGIKVGQPVINADGVLGRIVEAGRRTSRLLLLTDVDSRIPVIVGANQQRATLDGDNNQRPRLTMLAPEATIEGGEEVLTAGIGGSFPRGLRVGVSDVTRGTSRVTLNAALGALEYVSVLLYDNPGVSLTHELRSPPRDQQSGNRTGATHGASE